MTEKLILKSEISEIKKAREFFIKTLRKYNDNNIETYNFEIVIGEIISNIIKYGSKDNIIEILFEVSITDRDILMRFEYDGSVISEEDIEKYIQLEKAEDIFELKESGRGTFIVNTIMDSVKYCQNGKNAEVKLQKSI